MWYCSIDASLSTTSLRQQQLHYANNHFHWQIEYSDRAASCRPLKLRSNSYDTGANDRYKRDVTRMLDLKEMPNSTHATLQALTFSKTTNYTLSDLEHFDLGSIESVGRDLLEAHIKLPSGMKYSRTKDKAVQTHQRPNGLSHQGCFSIVGSRIPAALSRDVQEDLSAIENEHHDLHMLGWTSSLSIVR